MVNVEAMFHVKGVNVNKTGSTTTCSRLYSSVFSLQTRGSEVHWSDDTFASEVSTTTVEVGSEVNITSTVYDGTPSATGSTIPN
jgi:hypothetical protein